MTAALDGLMVLVPESRELDLFAELLEAEGAVAYRCPLLQICDLEDFRDCKEWIDALMAGSFADVIWLTGEGLRRLLAIADRCDCRASFVGALGLVRNITRGPKPARALRDIGLAANLAAPAPTSQGVRDALAGEDIAGRAIGVQLYPGDGGLPLVAHLRARGAGVFPVTPYRYASQAEDSQVTEAIRMLHEGRIGMIAFTSSPQVERLMSVARQTGLEPQLREVFKRVPMAAIGPVVEETLQNYGARNVLRPQANFHLKPLIRAMATAWSARGT